MKPNFLGDFAQTKYDVKRDGVPAARPRQRRERVWSAEDNVSYGYLYQISRACVTKERALVEALTSEAQKSPNAPSAPLYDFGAEPMLGFPAGGARSF